MFDLQHGGYPISTAELKPCPFCGGKVEIIKFGGGWLWRHVSGYGNCVISWGKKYHTEEEAVEAWNERVDNDKLHTEVKEGES